MRKLLLLVLFGLAFPLVGHAQGVRRDGFAIWTLGDDLRAIQGGVVSVCQQTLAGGPCTSTPTLYSNAAETLPLLQPFPVNNDGTYTYYASPGIYTETVTGSQIAPIVRADIPIGISNGGTVLQVTCGNITNLANCSVANPSTNAVISFTLPVAGAHSYWGNNAGSPAAPAYHQPNFTDLAGNIAISQMASGAGASSSTFWRGDGTWQIASCATCVTVAGSIPNNTIVIGIGGARAVTNIPFDATTTHVLIAGSPPAFGAITGAMLPNPAAATLGGTFSYAAVSHQFVTSITTGGQPVSAQPTLADIAAGSAPAGLFDFSTGTFKLPVAAGGATTANGNIIYDTTNKNWHVWDNGNDRIVGVFDGTALVNGDCVKITLASSVVNLTDAGAGCGAGGASNAFSALTNGTNTGAAMIIGTGASLTVSGSGTNTASNLTPAGTSGNIIKWGSAGAPADAGVVPPVTMAAVSHQFLTSWTGSTGLFTQAQPAFTDISGTATEGQLPAATVFTDQNATFGAHTYDATGSTIFKLRVSAGLTTSANGDIGYDTTNKNWHIWDNAADRILGVFDGTAITTGDCLKVTVAASVQNITDAGAPCGLGTVTHTAGALTANQLLAGNGSADLKVSNLTGDVTTTNTMATTLAAIQGNVLTITNLGVNDYICAKTASTFGNCPVGVPVNPQNTSPYAIASSDRGKLITVNSAGAFAMTIPQGGTAGFQNSFFVAIFNRGAGTITITPTTSTINGGATLTLTTNQVGYLYCDNSNYIVIRLNTV